MASIDHYLDRSYHTSNYHCLHFACDVWFDLTGHSIQEKLNGLLNGPKDRHVRSNHFKAFKLLPKPVDPCIVYFNSRFNEPHIGIYIRGKVLHLQKFGALYQTPEFLAELNGYTIVRYYTSL